MIYYIYYIYILYIIYIYYIIIHFHTADSDGLFMYLACHQWDVRSFSGRPTEVGIFDCCGAEPVTCRCM